MGGGKKRQSLKKQEKTQKTTKKKALKEAKPAAKSGEKAVAGIIPPNVKGEGLKQELKKLKVLTHYTVASHFNIRLSIAKNFLKDLERRGIVKFVSGHRRMRIYVVAD